MQDHAQRARALYVTGTDTGVGKTIVAACLARALRERSIDVGVMKPFASGTGDEGDWQTEDIALLRDAAGVTEPFSLLNPVRLKAPLAPLSAARIEGVDLDVPGVVSSVREYATRHQITIVEGIGGAAVPITGTCLVSDFIRELGYPALVVARSELGTINHTLLTVEHLRGRGVSIFGIVYVRGRKGPLSLAEETGPGVVAEMTDLPVFGLLPYSPELSGATDAAARAAQLPWRHASIRAVADAVVPA
jgi:dethiobiotin synthetase